MAFSKMRMSPNNTSEAAPMLSLEVTSTVAPAMPSNNPEILYPFTGSFSNQAAITVINIGVVSISNDACMGYVSDNPFINSNWLMAIPVKAHKMNLPRCLRCNLSFLLLNRKRVHNKIALMPTRSKLSPNGFTSPWLISCLTAVKLMAKNKLVNNNARCAFVLCFNMPVLPGKTIQSCITGNDIRLT